jgi:putative RecB family exonuclease
MSTFAQKGNNMNAETKKLYTGEYFSVSRVKQYEKCTYAFKLRYIDGLRGGTSEPAEFGKLVHNALERIYSWAVDDEFTGKIPDEVILEEYRGAFQESPLADNGLYQEGIELVRGYFRLHPDVNHFSVLAIEREFRIKIGDVQVLGFIDRIDRIDKNTVEIIDYKTNRMLFSREELDNDLQMSVYGLAVKEFWPWVENIRYRFDMIRFSMSLFTSRSEKDLDFSAAYLVALSRRLATQEDYPAQINSLCGWCDHRDDCSEFQKALKGHGLSHLAAIAADDIETICAERTRAANIEKIAAGRKREMDKLIKTHLSQVRSEKLVVAGTTFKLQTNFDTDYPLRSTLERIREATGVSMGELQDAILVVNAKRMEGFITEQRLTKTKQQLLSIQLLSDAKRSPKTPFVSAKTLVVRK